MLQNKGSRAGFSIIGSASAIAMAALAASPSHAGGFAVREQSASAQGSSYAGSAAGYDLSSQFWNPAALGTHQGGYKSESHGTLYIPDATIDVLPGTTLAPGGGQSIETSMLAFVGSSYAGYRFNRDLVVGYSFTTPFGLTTKPDDRNWAGQFHSRTSSMATYNLTANAAYQLRPGFYIGAGLQGQYIDMTLKSAAALNGPSAVLTGDDFAFGYTLGAFWQPSAWTSIGLGFRSMIEHDLDGDFKIVGVPGKLGIGADVTLPETLTLSIRQGISPTTRLLGTFEWTNWSRLQQVDITPLGTSLDFGWHDGWMFAGGIEHDVSQRLTLRTGLAWEKSPIQNPDERTPRIADNDRWTASVGLSYAFSPNVSFDLAYSHIFVDDAKIDRIDPLSMTRRVAEAQTDMDIVSASIKMRWGEVLSRDRTPLK